MSGSGVKTGLARSGKDRAANQVDQETAAPPRIRDHIDYGIVTGINEKQQLQCALYSDPDNKILQTQFWPLITPMDEIISKYGTLRKGMIVRVHWRGRDTANFAIVEVVGNEQHNLVEQKEAKNEKAVAPHKMMSGGIH